MSGSPAHRSPDVLPRAAGRTYPPPIARWVVACTAAEAIGLGAAAGASRVADGLVNPWAALAVVVAAGLVEGVALGSAQAWVLGRWLPRLDRWRYAALTVLVAGVGWSLGSAPSVFLAHDSGADPSRAVVLAGAATLGVALGGLLGVVQAVALLGAVPRPWRWVPANLLAWPPAMVLVFVGTSLPDERWGTAAVMLTGMVTGVVAGVLLGLITGWFLTSLDGPTAHNRVVLGLLTSPAQRLLAGGIVGLEVHGRVTHRCYRLPVQFATWSGGLVVVPGHPRRTSWWRNLDRPRTAVEVLWRGAWHPGLATVLRPGDPEYHEVRAAYEARFPRVTLPADQPVVLVEDATRVGNP